MSDTHWCKWLNNMARAFAEDLYLSVVIWAIGDPPVCIIRHQWTSLLVGNIFSATAVIDKALKNRSPPPPPRPSCSTLCRNIPACVCLVKPFFSGCLFWFSACNSASFSYRDPWRIGPVRRQQQSVRAEPAGPVSPRLPHGATGERTNVKMSLLEMCDNWH